VLVASDFDGTLSPIVDRPSRAVLHTDAPAALDKLACLRPRVQLAFLSGRSIDDLAMRLPTGLPDVIFAGNHGLELRGAGVDWLHPIIAQARPALSALAAQVRNRIQCVVGAELEDKGAGLALHYRRVASVDLPRLLSAIEQIDLPRTIRRHDGGRVIEYRPDVEWDKGYALRRIMQHLGIPPWATIFLGDDTTDEDGFRELNGQGIAVHVGAESAVSLADFHARDPADAVKFLTALAVMLQET
jgi:trehalose 6-phosphate phosphatase